MSLQLPIDPAPSATPISVLCIIETLGRGGGAEQLVASLAMPLRARGVELEFVDLFSWPDDLGVELQRKGFIVHRLTLSHRWNLVQGFMRLRAIVAKRRSMIVWGHLYFGNLYASLLGLTLLGLTSVITLHSTGAAQMLPCGFKGQMIGSFERWVNRRAQFIVAVSNAVRHVYRNQRGWTDVKVIHNGIDTEVISVVASVEERKKIRRQFNLSNDDFVITVPARFVVEKGHSVLLDAISYLANKHGLYPRILLMGQHTPLVDTLKVQRQRLGIPEWQLHFLPPIPQEELFAVLGASDLVVMPSIQEAFGMAAVEAMAAQTPVILSRVGGMAELDPVGECVIYIEPGDAPAIGEAIAVLMNEPDIRTTRGEACRRLALAQFSLDHCANAWQQLFEDI